MTLALRPVRAADLAQLAALHAQSFPDDPWSSAALATVLAMLGVDGRVAGGERDAPRGFLLDQSLGAVSEILTLCVAPAARRQGVARALLLDLIARAHRAGARHIALEVAADNAAARALYTSLGFRRRGVRRAYYRRQSGPPVDAWRLDLELPGAATKSR